MSPADSTAKVLVLPLRGLLSLGALLTGLPEGEDLRAEGPGLLLRSLQQVLVLLGTLPVSLARGPEGAGSRQQQVLDRRESQGWGQGSRDYIALLREEKAKH